jgi:hypothetical protein
MLEIRELKYWPFAVKKMCIWQFHIPIVHCLGTKRPQLSMKGRIAIVTQAAVCSITSAVNSQRTIQYAPLWLVLMLHFISILRSGINRSRLNPA